MRVKYPMQIRSFRANMVGKAFEMTVAEGIDSYNFAKQIMTSEYGAIVLLDKREHEYCCHTFMYSGFKRELQFKIGKTYDEFFMWFAGYLYKYWVDEKMIDTTEVWKLCPIDKLYTRFGFYHTQGWDYIINHIINHPF